MKNILVYINPQKKFDKEKDILVKIQIDNSLDLGWKKEDIILATNFNYEYRGVKSLIVADSNFCSFRPLSTKTITVNYLLKKGMIGKELYWVHDFDAYQLNDIKESELDIVDVGFTTYGWSPKWCLGSYFFRESAKDIFKLIRDKIYEIHNEDERALVALTRNNNIKVKELNITYNFGMRHIESNYKKAIKPIKVLHFHPWYKGGIKTLDIFMRGKNELNKVLMNKRLIKIFNSHGII